MKRRPLLPILGLLVFSFTVFLSFATSKEPPNLAQKISPAVKAEEFISVSDPATPNVSYAFQNTTNNLRLILDIGTIKNSTIHANIGLAAKRKIILNSDSIKPISLNNKQRFVFDIAKKDLLDTAADLNCLRCGFTVRWSGGPYKEDRLRWRFRHKDSLAPYDQLSSSSDDWQPVDLQQYQQQVIAKQNHQNAIQFTQAMDGKATIVIEDSAGNRVRNLLSGVPMQKGIHSVDWDQRNDNGVLVEPGTYHWRSAHHPGITANYLMTFCNWDNTGFRPLATNHAPFTAVATNGQLVFFVSQVSEGGFAMIAVDASGSWVHGYNHMSAFSNSSQTLAAADKDYLYVTKDGIGLTKNILDKNPLSWTAPVSLTLARYSIKSGKPVAFPGADRFLSLETYEYGPGNSNPKFQKIGSLSGFASAGGKLYISSRLAEAILVFDSAPGKKISEIKLAAPGALVTTNNGDLLAVSGHNIVRLTPEKKAPVQVITQSKITPGAITVDQQGNIFAVDIATNTIKEFDKNGKPSRSFGNPGGIYQGPFDPERMVNPSGITIMDGKLWVAEDRENPKRGLAWDLNTGKVCIQKFGNPPYGGAGAGFNENDPSTWIGLQSSWNIDYQKHAATCKSLIGLDLKPLRYHFFQQNGHDFVVAVGKSSTICQWNKDGTASPIVCYGSARTFSRMYKWNPPQAFAEAFNRHFPALNYVRGYKNRPQVRVGMLWVDVNGDKKMQAEEFDFTDSSIECAGAYWENDIHDLTLRLPALRGQQPLMVTLAPEGYYPGGAPKYPSLKEACRTAIPLDYPGTTVSDSIVDRFGNMICKTSPYLTAFSPNGKRLWTYPNNWNDVPGSHSAPLPETGVLQGALFFIGAAALDSKTDVLAIMGNYGRVFLLTSDGLYLDEMFKDRRIAYDQNDPFSLGDEPFGGTFGRATTDGQYYLHAGKGGYRIFRIDGFNNLIRQSGIITVATEENNSTTSIAKQVNEKTPITNLSYLTQPVKTDAEQDWNLPLTAQWSKSGTNPIKVSSGYDEQNLYLDYYVQDDSPWTNNGTDWTTLFKTGDCVDFQLGTNIAAPTQRKEPVPGDLRLLIAPSGNNNLAVLYKYKVPGTKLATAFSSPWRTITIDSVKVLSSAKIKVDKGNNWYRIKTTIPLADLGFKPSSGQNYKADFGVIFGDNQGSMNISRSYWANHNTGLTSDLPGEAMINPDSWGNLHCQGKGK